jgi:hypothetical protein
MKLVKLQTLLAKCCKANFAQGYIFRILQHFLTKFYNFTNFNKFFTGIYFFCLDQKLV